MFETPLLFISRSFGNKICFVITISASPLELGFFRILNAQQGLSSKSSKSPICSMFSKQPWLFSPVLPSFSYWSWLRNSQKNPIPNWYLGPSRLWGSSSSCVLSPALPSSKGMLNIKTFFLIWAFHTPEMLAPLRRFSWKLQQPFRGSITAEKTPLKATKWHLSLTWQCVLPSSCWGRCWWWANTSQAMK